MDGAFAGRRRIAQDGVLPTCGERDPRGPSPLLLCARPPSPRPSPLSVPLPRCSSSPAPRRLPWPSRGCSRRGLLPGPRLSPRRRRPSPSGGGETGKRRNGEAGKLRSLRGDGENAEPTGRPRSPRCSLEPRGLPIPRANGEARWGAWDPACKRRKPCGPREGPRTALEGEGRRAEQRKTVMFLGSAARPPGDLRAPPVPLRALRLPFPLPRPVRAARRACCRCPWRRRASCRCSP